MAEQQRKIVYFLGAGASLGAGAVAPVQGGGTIPIPTQSDFWETFLRFSASKSNRKIVERFLFVYFLGYTRIPSKLPPAKRWPKLARADVEEVFTFISERARAPATSPSMRTYCGKVWSALVEEISHVFRRFPANAETKKLYRKLFSNHIRTWDTVVSFNYDTVFEGSVPANRGYYYATVSSPQGVRVIKPHGSINWEDANPIEVREIPEKALVVAPTHLKFVQTSKTDGEAAAGYLDHTESLRNVWAEMETEMKAAKVLVFIGYSFPVADLYFSSVLRSVLADRDGAPGIVIVNPDARAIRDRLQARFPVPKVTLYYDLSSFAQASRKHILNALE